MTATITINSGTGSDSAASGAGPATALTGSGASLNATTAVDLSADTPDLSGVATDGTHVLYVVTSSGRKFGKITAVDNGTKIVTVESAYGVTESSRSWAIGGKRATLAGSLEPIQSTYGWSGNTMVLETDESVSSALSINNACTIKGSPATVTLTATHDGNLLSFGPNGNATFTIQDIKLINTNAFKTASTAIHAGWHVSGTASYYNLRNVQVGEGSNYFWKGFYRQFYNPFTYIDRCTFDGNLTHVDRTYSAGAQTPPSFTRSVFKNGGQVIIEKTGSSHVYIDRCVFYNNTTGINITHSGTNYGCSSQVTNCVFFGNSSHGFYVGTFGGSEITILSGNVFQDNTTSGWTSGETVLDQGNNIFYNNGTHASPDSSYKLVKQTNFVDAANDDFRVVGVRSSDPMYIGYNNLMAHYTGAPFVKPHRIGVRQPRLSAGH